MDAGRALYTFRASVFNILGLVLVFISPHCCADNCLRTLVGVAIGKFVDMLGSYWKDCPRKDKDKVYKILVSDYIAVHDFGTSAAPLKSSGFNVQGAHGVAPAAVPCM